MSLENCGDRDSSSLLDGILGSLPGSKAAFKQQWSSHPGVLKRPRNSCGPHSEPRLVYDCSLVANQAKSSKFRLKVSMKYSKALLVCSGNKVVEEIGVPCSGNMGSRIGGPRTGVEDDDVLR